MQASNNFTQLNSKLDRLGAPAGAAECHGFICAQLCLLERIDERAWRESLLPDDAEPGVLTDLRALGSSARKQLEAQDYTFELLLPPDEARLDQRVEALADWCRGFLFGLGCSGLIESGLTADCREMIYDMEQISRVEPDTTGREGEFALLELTEYVRIGAVSIYHELRARRTATGPPRNTG